MKIYMVRHGQDADNEQGILNGRRDTELTDLGRQQAKIAAEQLKDKNIEVICSSPLKRTHETASIIAKELGISGVNDMQDLIERDFGMMTGKRVKDIKKLTDKVYEGDRVCYFLEVDGAEDFPTLLRRGKKVLNEIIEKYPDKNVVIVTHGDIGKMIRCANNGWTWEEGLKTPYFENTGVLELEIKHEKS